MKKASEMFEHVNPISKTPQSFFQEPTRIWHCSDCLENEAQIMSYGNSYCESCYLKSNYGQELKVKKDLEKR